MARKSLIDANGTVVNVVLAGDDYVPPEGFTIGPDGGEIGWQWNGEIYAAPAPVARALTVTDFADAIQGLVDATARSRGYADGVTLASYKDSTVAAWASEATAFIAWRDLVWLSAYVLLGEANRGELENPTIDSILAKLPAITWPT